MHDALGSRAGAALRAWWAVIAPSLAFAGVQASWAVQIGHGSAHLRKLGLSSDLVGIAWLAGPITGVVVQPIVGSWSDRCTSRLGKRKPFMLAGAIGTLIGLLLFSNSGNIASWIGDPVAESGGGSRTGLGIAIASFWVVDAFTNALQAPARSHLGDIVPASEQIFGNAYFAVANGLGKIIGYSFGAFSSRIEIVYGLTGLAALILTLLTVFGTGHDLPNEAVRGSEGSVSSASSAEEAGNGSSPSSSWLALPTPLIKAFGVQFFTYFAWMLLFVYGANWVGKEVFNGSADAALSSAEHLQFVQGVRVANQGYLAMAIISIPVAIVLPWAMRVVGLRVVWCLSMLVFGGCLIATAFTSSALVVRLIFGLLSIPLASSFTIPWVIVASSIEPENEPHRGRLMATFNLSQSIPGILAAVLGGIIVRISDGNLTTVLCVGGVSAFVSAGMTLVVEIPEALQL